MRIMLGEEGFFVDLRRGMWELSEVLKECCLYLVIVFRVLLVGDGGDGGCGFIVVVGVG